MKVVVVVVVVVGANVVVLVLSVDVLHKSFAVVVAEGAVELELLVDVLQRVLVGVVVLASLEETLGKTLVALIVSLGEQASLLKTLDKNLVEGVQILKWILDSFLAVVGANVVVLVLSVDVLHKSFAVVAFVVVAAVEGVAELELLADVLQRILVGVVVLAPS